MKLDLDHKHSPCLDCFIRGVRYSPSNEKCQRCEYNISYQLLKKMIETHCGCSLCINRVSCVQKEPLLECKDHYVDWKAAFDEYGIEYEE